jgi:hypothetical protein
VCVCVCVCVCVVCPTEGDRDASIMTRPCPTRGCRPIKIKHERGLTVLVKNTD